MQGTNKVMVHYTLVGADSFGSVPWPKGTRKEDLEPHMDMRPVGQQ